MADVQLHLGDCLDVMAGMEPDSVDTVIADPPYGLEFMGKDWDHGVPGAPFWEAALRVAKPGAMLLAFGGTRTHHRLMCAIEDAGWEIRDCMMWVYGSGFPKSHDISKAIDKAAGAEREVVGSKEIWSKQPWKESYKSNPDDMGAIAIADSKDIPITAPATDAAAEWDGWGTALKPAWEPIIVAIKPRDGTFANNALTWGVAGLWVDGGRIPTNGSNAGRWPSNFILSHHAECVQVGTKRVRGSRGVRGGRESTTNWRMHHETGQEVGYTDPDGMETVEAWDCHPDCPVRILGEQSGENPVGGERASYSTAGDAGIYAQGGRSLVGYADTGTAARFFYTAKASKSERTCNGEVDNGHPTVKPVAILEYLARLTKTPIGGVVLDPFMGSGSTGIACVNEGRDFIGIEIDADYYEIAQRRIEHALGQVRQLELV